MKIVVLLLLLLTPLSGRSLAEPRRVIGPGDRVAVVGNAFADMMRKHSYFETLLLQRCRGVSLRNLGWAGDAVPVRQRPTGFPTEDQTLAAHETDILLVCFGMGESFDGKAGLGGFRDQLRKLIRHYQSQKFNGRSAPRLVVISPIAYESLGEITPHVESRNTDLAAYTDVMKEVAAESGAQFVDLFRPTLRLMGEEGISDLTVNGIRLNRYGYWAVGNILADALVPSDASWEIKIDAERVAGDGKGVRVRSVGRTGGAISFDIEESGWARPGPPPGSEPGTLPFERDVLTVGNLEPAYYTLTVDGEPVVTATHEEWARGVAIDQSPAHREADRYRGGVIDKNEQFFHSWRALNQVHIVGERRKSPSGRELPREVIEFNELAKERERELHGMEPPRKTRVWKLTANPERKLP